MKPPSVFDEFNSAYKFGSMFIRFFAKAMKMSSKKIDRLQYMNSINNGEYFPITYKNYNFDTYLYY